MPFSITESIPESLIESIYKHVHHADAIRLLEKARLAFVESIGFPNETLTERGAFIVLTRVEVQYKRELFAEEVSISCERPRIEGRRMWLDQEIRKANGKLAVLATIEMMFLDREKGRGVAPPEDFASAFLAVNS